MTIHLIHVPIFLGTTIEIERELWCFVQSFFREVASRGASTDGLQDFVTGGGSAPMGFSAQVGTRGVNTWQDTQHVFFPQPWSYLKQL